MPPVSFPGESKYFPRYSESQTVLLWNLRCLLRFYTTHCILKLTSRLVQKIPVENQSTNLDKAQILSFSIFGFSGAYSKCSYQWYQRWKRIVNCHMVTHEIVMKRIPPLSNLWHILIGPNHQVTSLPQLFHLNLSGHDFILYALEFSQQHTHFCGCI